MEVSRYYCQNPACAHQTFTNLPPDLLPYSPWRAEVHLAALAAYELGRGSYEQHPEAVELLRQLKRIFWAKTKRTAERRYERVLALRTDYVAQKPEVAAVFASLEHHL